MTLMLLAGLGIGFAIGACFTAVLMSWAWKKDLEKFEDIEVGPSITRKGPPTAKSGGLDA